MARYLIIYRNHEEYEQSREKSYVSHCIEEVHIHYDNTYYPGCDDGCPQEGCCDLDGGYYYI